MNKPEEEEEECRELDFLCGGRKNHLKFLFLGSHGTDQKQCSCICFMICHQYAFVSNEVK